MSLRDKAKSMIGETVRVRYMYETGAFDQFEQGKVYDAVLKGSFTEWLDEKTSCEGITADIKGFYNGDEFVYRDVSLDDEFRILLEPVVRERKK